MSTKRIQILGGFPQSDWNQTDETKTDYIKNKPALGSLAAKDEVVKTDLSSEVQELLGKADSAMQSYTETDPTVPSWAKASTKPSYTASEVGAVPTSRTVNGKALSADITIDIPDALADLSSDAAHRTVSDTEKTTWNAKSDFSGSYNDLTNKPTIPSIEGLATETYVDNKVAGLVDSSPEALNTLNELAAALGDDPNFATTVSTEIGKKVDKTTTVNGHALSGNVTVTKSDVGLGNVENKSSATIRGELTKANVTDALGYTPPESDTKYTHPSYTAKSSGLYKVTVDATGHVSDATAVTKADITGLGIPAQDTTYTHPTSHPATMITGLADVATSGSYNDLSNKPTIPAAYSHPSTHPASMITGLATVATSGSYNDLSNKPTIPSAYTHPTSHPASMITGLATVATSGSYLDLTDQPNSIPCTSFGCYSPEFTVADLIAQLTSEGVATISGQPIIVSFGGMLSGTFLCRFNNYHSSYYGCEFTDLKNLETFYFEGDSSSLSLYNSLNSSENRQLSLKNVPTFSLSGTTLTITTT